MTHPISKFTPEQADAICAWIAEGKSLAAWCRQTNTLYKTVTNWLKGEPEFQKAYIQAREDSADADADAMSDIRDRVLSGELKPDQARVAMDALKWSSGKRKPKVYGDRMVLAGDEGAPIATRVDLSGLTAEQLRALANVKLPADA